MTAKSRSRQEMKGKIKAPPAKPTKTKATALNPRRDTLRKMLLERRREVLKEIEELIGHRLSDDAQNRVDSVPDIGDQALLDSQRGRDGSEPEGRPDGAVLWARRFHGSVGAAERSAGVWAGDPQLFHG